MVRQGDRADLPVLRANADGTKLLKLNLGRLVIRDDRELGEIQKGLCQQTYC